MDRSIKIEDGRIVTDYTDEQREEAAFLLEQISSGDILFSYNEGKSKHYVDVFSILGKMGIEVGGGDWYAAAYEVIQDDLRRQQEQPPVDENPFKNELPEWLQKAADAPWSFIQSDAEAEEELYQAIIQGAGIKCQRCQAELDIDHPGVVHISHSGDDDISIVLCTHCESLSRSEYAASHQKSVNAEFLLSI